MNLVYIKVFLDWRDAIEPLGYAERGRLLTALLDYARTGEAQELDGNERFIFPMMKASLDRDNEALKELSSKRSSSGKLGGRPRKAEKANESNDNQKKQMVFLESKKSKEKEEEKEKDKDNDNEKDKDDEKEKEKDNEKNDLAISSEIACRSQDVRRVVDAWNSLGLSKVNKILLDTERGKMLRKRIKDYGIEDVLRAVENVRASPFLNGSNKNGWQATFDWFIRPNNFPKVLDGNYSAPNRGRVSQGNEFGDNIFLQLAEEGKYG